jgi:cysteine desulfurase/selenocysteine lyase
MEHHSNIVPWQLLAARTGAKLAYLPITGDDGLLQLDRLNALLDDKSVKLFAFTHVSNTLGTVNPVADLCARARQRNIVTLVDAAQSAGHRPVDVQEIGCDFMAFSGHKLCGPTGIGVLYGRRELLEAMPPFHGGGDMIASVDYFTSTWKEPPSRFEAGTPDFAAAIGLHAALDYLSAIGLDKIARHDQELSAYAYEQLSRLPGIRLFGPKKERSGVLSFLLQNIHAHDVVTVADQFGVALRGGHHCNQPLMKRLGVESTARASFYFYNTAAEVDRLFEVLTEIQKFFAA